VNTDNFVGHRDAVTALAFRRGTHTLFSGSADRSLKVWDCDELAYQDSLFGHQAPVTAMAALSRERVFTSGADRTVRLWKVGEQSQLIFRAAAADVHTDAVAAINDAWFLSGGADGAIALWHASKKRPVYVRHAAHAVAAAAGAGAAAAAGAGADDDGPIRSSLPQTCWISALAHCPGSDVLASGSGDGFVRLWRLVSERELAADRSGGGGGEAGGEGKAQQLAGMTLSAAEAARPDAFRGIVALGEPIAVPGIVNGLAFSADGRLLVAAVGREHRLGGWFRSGAGGRDGVLFVRMPALLPSQWEA
jgi:ribosomal RNA-processing protein 9